MPLARSRIARLPRRAYAAGLSPFGLEIASPANRRLSVFAETAGGGLVFSHAVPDVTGRRTNFTLRTVCSSEAALVGCQPNAPVQLGSSVVYVTGYIRTATGRQPIAIRLDRQACFVSGRIHFRDASGLGVPVIEQPQRGWTIRRYVFPANFTGARGYLNISGVTASYSLVRGSTDPTRNDSDRMEADSEWTLGARSRRSAFTCRRSQKPRAVASTRPATPSQSPKLSPTPPRRGPSPHAAPTRRNKCRRRASRRA